MNLRRRSSRAMDMRSSKAPYRAIFWNCCGPNATLFVAREDARMDAAGVDSLGISHRGKRYFANECQRERPSLRRMLFSETMADICRATLGDDAYFFFDQYVVKGPEGGLPFSWHQDSGYVVGNGGASGPPPLPDMLVPAG